MSQDSCAQSQPRLATTSVHSTGTTPCRNQKKIHSVMVTPRGLQHRQQPTGDPNSHVTTVPCQVPEVTAKTHGKLRDSSPAVCSHYHYSRSAPKRPRNCVTRTDPFTPARPRLPTTIPLHQYPKYSSDGHNVLSKDNIKRSTQNGHHRPNLPCYYVAMLPRQHLMSAATGQCHTTTICCLPPTMLS